MCNLYNLTNITMRNISSIAHRVLGDMVIDQNGRIQGETYRDPNATDNQIAVFDSWDPKRYFEYGLFSENDIDKMKNDAPVILSIGAGMCYVETIISELGTPIENIYVTDTFITPNMKNFPSSRRLDMFQPQKNWLDILGRHDFDYVFFLASFPMIKYGTNECNISYTDNELVELVRKVLQKSLSVMKSGGVIKIMQTELSNIHENIHEDKVLNEIAIINIPEWNRYQQIEVIKK